MKTFFRLATIVAFCFMSLSALAQHQKPTPEERATKMTDRMKTELSLDDQQYQKVHAINVKYAEKTAEVRSKRGDRQEILTAMREINKERRSELKSVLSEEQMQKFAEMQKQGRSSMKKRRPA